MERRRSYTTLTDVARFVAFNWREYTCVPPSGAQHLAQGVDEVQAFRVGGMGWATQFHPEIDEQMAPRWVHDAASGI